MRWAMVSCTISLLVAQQAPLLAAQETCTPGELRSDCKPTCISIEWDVTGDSGHDAGCAVQYREKGAAEWKKALPLFRVNYRWWYHTDEAECPFNMFAGSIMFLKPGTMMRSSLPSGSTPAISGSKNSTSSERTNRTASEHPTTAPTW